MKITRRQLRDIIIKETRRKRLDQIGKGLNHPFYTNDYDPAGKPVGFDYNSPNVDQNRDDVLDADELRDIADSLDGDRHSTSGNGPRDIVHARLGEVYKENAMEADLSIWLEEHPEFKLVAPGTEFSGWWGTDIIDEESWYVDGPEEGPVNESRIVGGKMKITHSQLRSLILEESQSLKEYYPAGGESEKVNPRWTEFREAAMQVASEFVDAGMESDGVESAMIHDIQSMFRELNGQDVDGDGELTISEGPRTSEMPASWQQILGNLLD